MAIWFEGGSEIGSSLEQIRRSIEDHGEHFVGVIGLMPGLSTVELVDQRSDSVTIKTNEGLMNRTNIAKQIGAARVVVEFDEVYEAGSKVTARSHFVHEFTPCPAGVNHRLVISDVDAPGFLGFLYRHFGAKKMGNAFLKAYSEYFASQRS